jgi:hypothetical protein
MALLFAFVIVIVALVAVSVIGVAVHLLFSPWLLLLVAAVAAWALFHRRGLRR